MLSKCNITNKIIGIWNYVPGYYDKHHNFIRYEKTWYCNNSKTIHTNLKQRLNCDSCNKEHKLKHNY
mgnify:FL=1